VAAASSLGSEAGACRRCTEAVPVRRVPCFGDEQIFRRTAVPRWGRLPTICRPEII